MKKKRESYVCFCESVAGIRRQALLTCSEVKTEIDSCSYFIS